MLCHSCGRRQPVLGPEFVLMAVRCSVLLIVSRAGPQHVLHSSLQGLLGNPPVVVILMPCVIFTCCFCAAYWLAALIAWHCRRIAALRGLCGLACMSAGNGWVKAQSYHLAAAACSCARCMRVGCCRWRHCLAALRRPLLLLLLHAMHAVDAARCCVTDALTGVGVGCTA